MAWRISTLFLAASIARSAAQKACPVNASKQAPLSCPPGSDCCRGQFWGYFKCTDDDSCNVCAECCHDELKKNQSLCNSCVQKSCPPGSFGDWGCTQTTNASCCPGGQPDAPSTTLANCLLIGDSVTNGMFPVVKSLLQSVCAVQHIESVDCYAEDRCFWSTSTYSGTGEQIKWDLIHYNEGLHSLYPRVNTTEEQQVWAEQLGNFTKHLQATGAKLIYATMTPFMPEKYLNPPGPPQNDVEIKNAIAVSTVKALGVETINDLYTTVTNVCGKVYRNCSICDDESAYHPQGKCGYHYTAAGWDLLGNATATIIKKMLSTTKINS